MLAFGDKAVYQQLVLDALEAGVLAQALGYDGECARAITSFFSDGEALLSDLLDVCNREGIRCRFCTIGGTVGALSFGDAASAPARRGEATRAYRLALGHPAR